MSDDLWRFTDDLGPEKIVYLHDPGTEVFCSRAGPEAHHREEGKLGRAVVRVEGRDRPHLQPARNKN